MSSVHYHILLNNKQVENVAFKYYFTALSRVRSRKDGELQICSSELCIGKMLFVYQIPQPQGA